MGSFDVVQGGRTARMSGQFGRRWYLQVGHGLASRQVQDG